MRYLSIFSFSIALWLFFSCSDNTGKSNLESVADKKAIEWVKYADKNIVEEAPSCLASPDRCAVVRINYPEITEAPASLPKDLLNSHIQKAILKGSLDPEGQAGEVTKACKKFIEDFTTFEKEMEQEVAAWSIEIDIEVINNDANYFSLRIDENAYLGGAHPNQHTSFLNYDIVTGQKVTLDQLIKDTDRLRALAEQKFREAKKLPPGANLSEAGYFFEEGEFTLTHNFGISQGNLLLYYNNYDIAPYALGPTLLELPLEIIL